MKDFEREEANINELEQIGEFVNFDAEDFKSKEEYLPVFVEVMESR